MEILVTGGDTDLGRTIARAFHDAGHRLTLLGDPAGQGLRAGELELTAEELGATAVSCDNTDPASLIAARGLIPHHLDAIVNVPALPADSAPEQTGSDASDVMGALARSARVWHAALNANVVSAVLTVQSAGAHLRSGGSIIVVLAGFPDETGGGATGDPGTPAGAAKAALSNWVAGQAATFGARGITVNVVAPGTGGGTGYQAAEPPPAPGAAEIARLALFLTTPAARHITGQTLHAGHRALARLG